MLEVSHSRGTGVSHIEKDDVSHIERDVIVKNHHLNQEQDPAPAGAGAAVEAPTHLEGDLWRVPSPRRTQGFIVNLKTRGCECENRSSTPCRHVKAAEGAAERAEKVRRRKLRDGVWGSLVALYGKPSTRARKAFGSAANAMIEVLESEGIVGAGWPDAIRQRHLALADEWGIGKVTMNALATNLGLAGKMLKPGGDERFDQDELDFLRGEA